MRDLLAAAFELAMMPQFNVAVDFSKPVVVEVAEIEKDGER